MLNPKTPTKADDGIEQLKQSLSAKWGIQFPVRDSKWSPSHRNLSLVEEKIATRIQFLYFQPGALRHAIEQFERHAFTLYSQWQSKPRAEVDVLPSRESEDSALKKDFLHKRSQLEGDEVEKLTEILWLQLSEVVDRVKRGEKFPVPTLERSRTAFCTEIAPGDDVSHHQPSLTQRFRNESELSAMPVGLHASSDDFNDEDMVDVFNEATWAPTLTSREEDTKTTALTSPTDDKFETPPSTPPKTGRIGLGIDSPGSEMPDSFYYDKPELVSVTNRKRSFADCMEPPTPCKSSRETRIHCAGFNRDNLAPATERSDKSFTNLAGNTPPPGEKTWFTFARTGSQSLINFASVSSSITTASPAWTSPNTSFCSTSVATSFGSNADDTNSTMHPKAVEPPSIGNSTRLSVAHTTARVRIGQVQETLVATSAPDNMDIDSEPTVTYTTAVESDVESKRSGELEDRSNSSNDVERLLAERLSSHSPFATRGMENYSALPFRQLYEVIRISRHCKLDLSLFLSCTTPIESYEELWSMLSKIVRAHGKSMPERSSLAAWHRAGLDFEMVALSGTLQMLNERKGPVFTFALHPLRVESSHRLSRQFGSDRFCVLGMSGLGPESLPSYLRTHAVIARATIIKWLIDTGHHFLGRTWRAFYTNPTKSKSLKSDQPKYRVYFFAENGTGFRQVQSNDESNAHLLERPQMSVRELIQWFMPTKPNESQPALKFFARLALAVSSTAPTVEFTPSEIFRSDDARADAPCQRRLDYRRSDEKKIHMKPSESNSPVMNDGCARISREAARGIAHNLGLDNVPCCFQGRIGGAKGMWMIDIPDETPSPHGRNYWIEITDSQLKFEGHATDAMYPVPARVTFEVNDFPKRLLPGYLSFQLLPILMDRKVPANVFITLLEKDLTARSAELEVAMDSGRTIRKWNQANSPVTEERARYGGIEMQGGLPLSRAEKINWFVEHGFEPKTCQYLKNQLYKVIMAYCLRLENKMKIRLDESTNAFMIADPLAVLEENEVHIAFSTGFKDQKTGMDLHMLHNIDVLVARSPAHLPSDIRKVRAVYKLELQLYRDVVVFPSKGSVALASLLSGGDYDGDKAWICWDPDIVGPFENADVPDHPKIEFYGIEKDNTKIADLSPHQDYNSRFLRHAFDFNLQMNMLGICSQYHEAYCYKSRAINNAHAMSVGMLLGNLVDSAKGGFKFDEAKWAAFKRMNKLPMSLAKPAYKDKNNQKPTTHLIDHLVFVTAKNTRVNVLKKFTEQFKEAVSWDDDLIRIRNEAFEEAKNNKELAEVLANFEKGIRAINTYWKEHVGRDPDDNDTRPTTRPGAPSFRTMVERCREGFIKLSPELNAPPTSDRIASWQSDHSAGRFSHWDHLKASVAFYLYSSTTFIWHVAGTELGEIKAMARGRGMYRIVVGEVFESFKLDPKIVDAATRRMLGVGSGGNSEVEDDFDEFGDFDVM